MFKTKLSQMFKLSFKILNIFGIWAGRSRLRYLTLYTAPFQLLNLVIYDIALTLNLLYTPQKIEFLIREVIFNFTEIDVWAKVYMTLKHVKKIQALFDIINKRLFEGSDEVSRDIVTKSLTTYNRTYKTITIFAHVAFILQVLVPIIKYIMFNTHLELPVSHYYFLDQDIVNKYFVYWYIYQSFGMYSHVQYTVNVDALLWGLMLVTLTQLKVLNHELKTFTISKRDIESGAGRLRFGKILEHFNLILKYSEDLQNLISFTMFVQFGVASAVICVMLCGLTLHSSTETFIFMVLYLGLMTSEIYVPSWLGSQILYESQDLQFAAYSCNWILMPQTLKKSMLIFMERAKLYVQFSGLSFFHVALGTFITIIKMAYSLFTLVRNVQDKEKKM